MKLDKKSLVARTLGIGKARVVFNKERLTDIKEAITKQDIRDLVKDGAIFVREIDGRKKKVRTTRRRRAGSVRKHVSVGKKHYVAFIRKGRAHLRQLKQSGQITKPHFTQLRKELKSRIITSRTHLAERIKEDVK